MQNFPVIPPIAAVKSSGSRSQSRGQSHDGDVEDVSEGDTGEVREAIKKRNKHLLKVIPDPLSLDFNISDAGLPRLSCAAAARAPHRGWPHRGQGGQRLSEKKQLDLGAGIR